MKYLRLILLFSLILASTSNAHSDSMSGTDSKEYTHFKVNHSLKKSESMVNILTQLYTLLGDSYKQIGGDEVERILRERDMGEGVLNYGGFSWYKPLGNFEVAALRQIAPEMHTDRWIVHDSFVIYINATSLLTNLKNDGTITITDKALALFAGLNFTRTYNYYHFAPTYSEALVSDFSKLFLSFTRFEADNVFTVKNEEMLSRQDKLQVSSTLFGNLPLTTGLSLGIATSAKLSLQNSTSYQHIKNANDHEEYRISQESIQAKEVNSHLSVKLDFFSILQETLFSHDLQYKLTDTKKAYLTINSNQVEEILANPEKKGEVTNFLKGSPDYQKLKDYEVSYEQRKKENYKSKFGFLLLGKIRKKSLEQIKIIKDQTEKIFFKSYFESIDYVQSFLSKIYSSIINRIFKIEVEATNNLEISKRVSFEYERLGEVGHLTQGSETLSIHISQSFEAGNIKKKKRKEKAINHIKILTNLDNRYEKKILEKQLVGPMRIIANLKVETLGIKHFNSLSKTEAMIMFFKICKVATKHIDKIKDESSIKEILGGKLNSSLRCAKKHLDLYTDYLESYKEIKVIDITLLKKLLEYTFKKAENYKELMPLFGTDNLFIHGQFSAMTDKGFPFRTYFESGQFKEFGVIDRYKLK